MTDPIARFRRLKSAPVALSLATFGACLLPACSAGIGGGAFQPAVTSGRAGGTYAATSYRVAVGSSDLGKATVWTEGQTKNRLIGVRLRVKNETTAPMKLDVDKARLVILTKDKKTIVVPSPAKVGGTNAVAADASTDMQLGYVLPDTISANDVTAYRLDWLLQTPSGDFRQATDFLRSKPTEHAGTCPDFYSALGYCAGWDNGQWVGFDDPNDPAMPLSR